MTQTHQVTQQVGLIFLFCSPLGLMGCGGNESPPDVPATGASNEVAVEILYQVDPGSGKEFTPFEGGNIISSLETALAPVSQTVAYTVDTFVVDAVWNAESWQDFHDQYKKNMNYRYSLACVEKLKRFGQIDAATGFTPLPYMTPGEDSDPTRPISFMLWNNIDSYAWSNNNDNRWWPMVFVHEMGRQRASLRAYTSTNRDGEGNWWDWHRDTQYRDGKYCVMHLMDDLDAWFPATSEDMYELIMSNIRFCGSGDDWDSSRISCLRYLEQREKGSPP